MITPLFTTSGATLLLLAFAVNYRLYTIYNAGVMNAEEEFVKHASKNTDEPDFQGYLIALWLGVIVFNISAAVWLAIFIDRIF